MRKIYLILIVLILAAASWFFLKNDAEVVINTPTPTPIASPESTASPSPAIFKNVITYTDSGYTSNIITIKKGETVTWKNQSSGGMWTASNPHPIHTEYPQNGGCINSAFDECKADPTGTEWSFTFTRAGTWGYHNHLNSRDRGTIVVE